MIRESLQRLLFGYLIFAQNIFNRKVVIDIVCLEIFSFFSPNLNKIKKIQKKFAYYYNMQNYCCCEHFTGIKIE